MRVPSAGAVEAGWSNLGIGVKAEDRVHGAAAEPSDLDIAHRRGALRGATANSRGSFTSVRKAITSRARTVSSRATGHVLEVG
jgi:predicted secreted Zn-dependent protease